MNTKMDKLKRLAESTTFPGEKVNAEAAMKRTSEYKEKEQRRERRNAEARAKRLKRKAAKAAKEAAFEEAFANYEERYERDLPEILKAVRHAYYETPVTAEDITDAIADVCWRYMTDERVFEETDEDDDEE